VAHLGRVDVGDADLVAMIPEGVAIDDAGYPPGTGAEAEAGGLAVVRRGPRGGLHREDDQGRQRQQRAKERGSSHGGIVRFARRPDDPV
jgi:hypothetical protein